MTKPRLIALGRIVDVRLQDGRVFHPVLHWIVTTQAHSTYDSLHWHRPPTGAAEMIVADDEPARVGPVIESVSYVARKGMQNAVYEHAFEEHEIDNKRWQARILFFDGQRSGATRSPKIASAGSNGAPVLIGCTHGRPRIAIEARFGAHNELFPYMTDHGIEG